MSIHQYPGSYPTPSVQAPAHHVWTDVPKPEIRHGRSFLRELLETVVLIAAIYAFVNLATARFVVDGRSMLPNFNTDQFIIVSRLSYILGEPKRGDVVVFHNPADPTHDFIKRVIGLPGETVTIQNGRVYVNGVRLEEPYIQNFCRGTVCDDTWEIGPEEYFVLGDNRSSSRDSHNFGPISRELLVGRAFIRYWPPSDWAVITHPSYDDSSVPLPALTLPAPDTDVPAVQGGGALSVIATPTPRPALGGQ
ncbi:MAG: signal peptidase I [Chloroflexota bacterium]|nr:signal peptidase I [Anaerolineae bacterium]HMM28693.1 signal peptidase I [Aggregatilineaceae bacterium]